MRDNTEIGFLKARVAAAEEDISWLISLLAPDEYNMRIHAEMEKAMDKGGLDDEEWRHALKRSTGEIAFERYLRAMWPDKDAVPAYVIEYQFCPSRRWRFDFAWPEFKVAVEIEGGTWSKGRHVRGSGFEKDCEKYNVAAVDGWVVLRYTPKMLKDYPTVIRKQLGLVLGIVPGIA